MVSCGGRLPRGRGELRRELSESSLYGLQDSSRRKCVADTIARLRARLIGLLHLRDPHNLISEILSAAPFAAFAHRLGGLGEGDRLRRVCVEDLARLLDRVAVAGGEL